MVVTLIQMNGEKYTFKQERALLVPPFEDLCLEFVLGRTRNSP